MFSEIKTKIELLAPKKLVGCKIRTSLTNNKTFQVWQNFMTRKDEILHKVNSSFISLQEYDPLYFLEYNAENVFYKWAAIEVSRYENIPEGMESIDLPGGLYAVFDYKGQSTDANIYQYVFTSWLPHSYYKLDDRLHIEILKGSDNNNIPESGDEIWVPIKHRLLVGM